jgi:hypothetical protein
LAPPSGSPAAAFFSAMVRASILISSSETFGVTRVPPFAMPPSSSVFHTTT